MSGLLLFDEKPTSGSMILTFFGESRLHRIGRDGRRRSRFEFADVFGKGGYAGFVVTLLPSQACIVRLLVIQLLLQTLSLGAKCARHALKFFDLLILERESISQLLLDCREVSAKALYELMSMFQCLPLFGQLLQSKGM